MTTVACGLRAGLLCSALCFVPMFKKVADVIGVYRWVAGLYANHYVLTQLANGESIGLSAMAGTPWSAWKTFFDQIISALSGRENWHTAGVKAFLKDHGGALYNDKDTTSPRWRLPRPMPSKLTENTTLEMQRVALLHIQGKAGGGGFEAKRIYPYMRQWLAADQLRAGPKIHPETKKGIALMLKFSRAKPVPWPRRRRSWRHWATRLQLSPWPLPVKGRPRSSPTTTRPSRNGRWRACSSMRGGTHSGQSSGRTPTTCRTPTQPGSEPQRRRV